ncbi:addiction module protein [bacterium]|nr:addiction module protein [bacterium]
MVALAEKVYEEALDLPTDDRLKLIDKLLHSTNLPIQMDIDKAWALEVEKRSKQIEEGTAKLIPGEEVFLKIKNRLAQ